jgi:hypothetical protein
MGIDLLSNKAAYLGCLRPRPVAARLATGRVRRLQSRWAGWAPSTGWRARPAPDTKQTCSPGASHAGAHTESCCPDDATAEEPVGIYIVYRLT